MDTGDNRQIRDVAIKLEAKMEVMSDSMVSLATSVEKLADIRIELVSMKKDISLLHQLSEKRTEDMTNMWRHIRNLEATQNKNSYVIGKIELFWSALIAGGASFVWWLLKG